MNTLDSNHQKSILDWYKSSFQREAISETIVTFGLNLEGFDGLHILDRESPLVSVLEINSPDILIIKSIRQVNTNDIYNLLKANYRRENPKNLGFLFVDETDDLDWLLSKISYGFKDLSCALSIDAINKTMKVVKPQTDPQTAEFNVEVINEFLNQGEWDFLGIEAHGEAAHLNLNFLTLCGAITDQETLFDGTKVIGGCGNETCKRVTANPYIKIPIPIIKARVIMGLTCHGFSVAGQQFPSLNSTARAFILGYASHFISALDSQAVRPNDIYRIQDAFQRGQSFGEIVHNLNLERLAKGEPPTFLLMGRPQQSFQQEMSGDIAPSETKTGSEMMRLLYESSAHLTEEFRQTKHLAMNRHLFRGRSEITPSDWMKIDFITKKIESASNEELASYVNIYESLLLDLALRFINSINVDFCFIRVSDS